MHFRYDAAYGAVFGGQFAWRSVDGGQLSLFVFRLSVNFYGQMSKKSQYYLIFYLLLQYLVTCGELMRLCQWDRFNFFPFLWLSYTFSKIVGASVQCWDKVLFGMSFSCL